MVIAKGKCDCCGVDNTECMVIDKRFWVFFVTEVCICQRCVSKALRLCQKGI